MTQTLARPKRSADLLHRLLEEPDLVSIVRNLEAPVLKRLIDHIGLEDAGEIVALATSDQLKNVFDEDLWRSDRPGEDETFDANRFGLWLEIMLEIGEEFAVRKLTELDEDLVTLALMKHVLVVDIDDLAVKMSEPEDRSAFDQIEKALEGSLYQELDEIRIIARTQDHWDAILSMLLALDRENHTLLRRLLDRCCFLSTEYIEDNGGLYEVLSSEDSLEGDVGADREQRRERAGHVAPSSAASFLALARITAIEDLFGAADRDPITKAYFRHYAPEPSGSTAQGRGDVPPGQSGDDRSGDETAARVRLFMAEMGKAGVLPQEVHVARRLEGRPTIQGGRPARIAEGMTGLRDNQPVLYEQRIKELNYLVNVLVSGCSHQGRAFRFFEAAEAVMATCELGLEAAVELARTRSGAHAIEPSAAFLAQHDMVKLFRLGWRLLHERVSSPAGHALATAMRRHLRTFLVDADRDVESTLAGTVQSLECALAAGKPWLFRRELDALETVYDESTVAALRFILDECPSLPRLPTDPDRPREEVGGLRTGRSSTFISGSQDMARIDLFLASL